MGVGGTLRNVSYEGLLIDSRLDLVDVCQIFPEALEDRSSFELEVVLTDVKERRWLVRGTVIWYRVSQPEEGVRLFRAGLSLRDAESRAIARSVTRWAMSIKGVEGAVS